MGGKHDERKRPKNQEPLALAVLSRISALTRGPTAPLLGAVTLPPLARREVL